MPKPSTIISTDQNKMCSVVSVAVDLLKCQSNTPVNTKLCNMTAEFSDSYCESPVTASKLKEMQQSYQAMITFKK